VCAAIDTTLGAVSSGTLHLRVGAGDPRGLFAKRVLHDNSRHALGITSLRPLNREDMVYKCATCFQFRVLKNLGRHAQLIV
jgi:hypothetical protein